MSFFSEATHQYPILSEGDTIQTLPFLLASQEIVPFFDVLGPTAFSPVKKDISGNIQRLHDKYTSDPLKYNTLQSIVDSELDQGIQSGKYSCTLGLLWLKRALEFIYVFLDKVMNGEHDLVKCANIAYENSLKKYHGWLVRGIFAVAVRAVPYYDDFINSLKKKDISEEQVLSEMRSSMTGLKRHIDEINKLFDVRGLHFEDTV